MRTAARILAALMVLIGGVWVLQGVNILPGSRMSGDSFWAGAGLVALILGLALGVGSVLRRSAADGP